MRRNTILKTAALAAFLGLTCSCENKTSSTSVPAPSKSQLVSDETHPIVSNFKDIYPAEKDRGYSQEKISKINNIISECFNEKIQERFSMLYDKARAQKPDAPTVSIDPGISEHCKYPSSQTETGSFQMSGSYDPHSLFINKKGETTFMIRYSDGSQYSTDIMLTVKKSENGWTLLDKVH